MSDYFVLEHKEIDCSMIWTYHSLIFNHLIDHNCFCRSNLPPFYFTFRHFTETFSGLGYDNFPKYATTMQTFHIKLFCFKSLIQTLRTKMSVSCFVQFDIFWLSHNLFNGSSRAISTFDRQSWILLFGKRCEWNSRK